jgi:hypothetical protein
MCSALKRMHVWCILPDCMVHLIRFVLMVYLIRCVVPEGVYSVRYQTTSVILLIRVVCMVYLIRRYVWHVTSYKAVCTVYFIRLHM